MNILLLNGSPAGRDSITLQTAAYGKILFPEHIYTELDVGQRIKSFEKDFDECEQALKEADLVIFCYPVYTFLVPAQLQRFIEIIKEKGIDLTGKYATQITTSKHFYDITAHEFIKDNCADLKMRYIRGLSADMEDLLSKKGQEDAESFFRYVFWNMENSISQPYVQYPETDQELITAADTAENPVKTGRAVIVTDLTNDTDGRLQAMIRRFRNRVSMNTDVVDLQEFPFAGGCLGCFNCAASGKCIYKDGFDAYLRENIQKSDAIVYAYTIKDHSMGYRFKLFDDRQFCNGHRTVTMGRPVAYLVDGRLDQEPNLRTLMEARSQVGGNFPAGIASDEHDPDQEIDDLAASLAYAVNHHYETPANFYGVGGMKIFRDLIWQMQGLMREDHRFYKEHGFYDFPQKKKGMIAGMYAVGAMMHNEKIRKKMGSRMTEGMIMPYKGVLKKAARKAGKKK